MGRLVQFALVLAFFFVLFNVVDAQSSSGSGSGSGSVAPPKRDSEHSLFGNYRYLNFAYTFQWRPDLEYDTFNISLASAAGWCGVGFNTQPNRTGMDFHASLVARNVTSRQIFFISLDDRYGVNEVDLPVRDVVLGGRDDLHLSNSSGFYPGPSPLTDLGAGQIFYWRRFHTGDQYDMTISRASRSLWVYTFISFGGIDPTTNDYLWTNPPTASGFEAWVYLNLGQGTDNFNHFFGWRVTHGLLNLLAWGMFFPLGAFIARYLRPVKFPSWVPGHVTFQVTGITLASIAFGLIVNAFHSIAKQQFVGTHRIMGLILYILVCSNVLVGTASLIVYGALKAKVPMIVLFPNQAHRILGWLLLIVAQVQVFFGFQLTFDPMDGGEALYTMWSLFIFFYWNAVGWAHMYYPLNDSYNGHNKDKYSGGKAEEEPECYKYFRPLPRSVAPFFVFMLLGAAIGCQIATFIILVSTRYNIDIFVYNPPNYLFYT